MKTIINIFLILICAVLAYLIALNVKEPITFNNALEEREGAVAAQLTKIRNAQEVYKKITGEYAGSFDTLKMVLDTANIETYKIIGNLDDENATTEIETIYTKASDSLSALGISIDSLNYVPYGKPGAEYSIQADTLTYQNTLVNVVEVGIPYRDFMGKYGDDRYMKYNPFYIPSKKIKFGDLYSPNTSGNWKR